MLLLRSEHFNAKFINEGLYHLHMPDEPNFKVLLNTVDLQGSISELRAASFFRKSNLGVVESIEAVHNNNLVQVPAYALINGRSVVDANTIGTNGVEIFEKVTEPGWNSWHDSLGERLTLRADKSYDKIKKGLYVVDLIGAGLFMSRPTELRKAIGKELKNGAYPVSIEEKDLLFGEKQAYRFDGTTIQTVTVRVFTSYESFLEESKTPAFQASLSDLSAVYAVVRTAAEARRNISGYQTIETQLENPDLIIPAGGKSAVENMLGRANEARFGWQKFGSYHDGYNNKDSGRVVIVNDDYSGVNCKGNVGRYGRSLGIVKHIDWDTLSN
ncbi:MAG: hypothetical protein ACI8Y7_001027 [Candidatus Woesearchaeota archaeon]|jgi:hypothetical protein